ncbi:MAG: hypothetical protein OXC37_00360 [Bdellovibrionaceae bacterium]|nr:hypothetical protein [Pseudobdellovibrionaceae bacterium]
MKLLVFLSLFLISPIYATEDIIGEWVSTEVKFPYSWFDKIRLRYETKEIQYNFKEDQILIQKSLIENLLEICLLEIVSPYYIYNFGKRSFLLINVENEEKVSFTTNCSTVLSTDTYRNKELEAKLKKELHRYFNFGMDFYLDANSLTVQSGDSFASFTRKEVL